MYFYGTTDTHDLDLLALDTGMWCTFPETSWWPAWWLVAVPHTHASTEVGCRIQTWDLSLFRLLEKVSQVNWPFSFNLCNFKGIILEIWLTTHQSVGPSLSFSLPWSGDLVSKSPESNLGFTCQQGQPGNILHYRGCRGNKYFRATTSFTIFMTVRRNFRQCFVC